MKEVENINNNAAGKGNVTDRTITQVKPGDFFAFNSTGFKKTMKAAGVANVENEDAVRSLFIVWLMGVKGMSSADVIRTVKQDKNVKMALGQEFVEYFDKRPVLGKAGTTEEVEARIRDFSKMIYMARKQLLVNEKLRYPTNLNIRNEATYELMRKNTLGFAAELEVGLETVTANWLNDDNKKTDVNPNGISFSDAFMEGYGEKKRDIEGGITSYVFDQNKMKLVRGLGKITKKLSDKKLSQADIDHYIRVGKYLPYKRNCIKTDEEWAEIEAKQRKKNVGNAGVKEENTIEETATMHGTLIGDVLETLVDSTPSQSGKNAMEKSINGMKEAIDKLNKTQEAEINNALSIVAHRDNSAISEIAINKGDRYKKGLDLSDASEQEIDEAAEAFDRLYSPVNKVAVKYLKGAESKLINQITVNGESVTDLANKALKGKDTVYSYRIKYAKAMAVRAFLNPELHLFYKTVVGNIDPTYEIHSSGSSTAEVEMKDSVAIKPEDFRIGLKYDAKEGEEINSKTGFKATLGDNAKLPEPVYDENIDAGDYMNYAMDEQEAIHQKVKVVKNLIVDKNIINQENIIIEENNDQQNVIEEEPDKIVQEGNAEKNADKIIPEGMEEKNAEKINPEDALRARKFVEGFNAYQEGLKGVIDMLTAIKGSILQNMKDPEKFGKKDMEGSQQFKDFALQLQKTINTCKDPDKDSLTIAKSFRNLKKAADTYTSEQIMLRADADGSVMSGAFEIISMGDKLSNLIYDMRVGVCGYTGETEAGKKTAYGNLSYNMLKAKSDELTAAYKGTPEFNMEWKRPVFDEMYDIADMQLKIQKKMEKVSRTMCRNFEYTKMFTPDKYNEMSPKRTVTALARWIVTKQFLEEVYRPGITMDELQSLEQISTKDLKKRINNLAKDPLFKQIVKKNPEKVFSAWDNITKPKKSDFFKSIDSEIEKVLNGLTEEQLIESAVKDFQTSYDHKEQVLSFGRLAKHTLLKSLKNPEMEGVTRILTAMNNDDRDSAIYDISAKLREKIASKYIQGNDKNLNNIIKDPKLIKDAVKDASLPKNTITAGGVKRTAQVNKTVGK